MRKVSIADSLEWHQKVMPKCVIVQLVLNGFTHKRVVLISKLTRKCYSINLNKIASERLFSRNTLFKFNSF